MQVKVQIARDERRDEQLVCIFLSGILGQPLDPSFFYSVGNMALGASFPELVSTATFQGTENRGDDEILAGEEDFGWWDAS